MTGDERRALTREVAAGYECSAVQADNLIASISLMAVSAEAVATILCGMGRDEVMAIIRRA